jgi:hypothetical protein
MGPRMASLTAFCEKSDVGIVVDGLRTATMIRKVALAAKADISKSHIVQELL